ncbi:hypothetical protein LZ618_06590 [Aeromonas allosaccharophila]|nr:hypothetical protein [Aeromonas allosaccharophila]
MAKNKFKYPISGSRSTTTLRSHELFDTSYEEPQRSPIDIYQSSILSYKKLMGCFTLDNTSGIYISLAESRNSEWDRLANLLILGFISSVESYVRCLIRKLLLLDSASRKKSYNRELTYGAAMHHNKELMPEALMEGCSFHSAYNIKETIKNMTGVSLLNLNQDPELDTAFKDFDFIAELRHCVVHRSGLFGSNNALSLGLEEYKDFLEKPIKLDVLVIQQAANACDTLVKEINDKMFSEILSRTISEYSWSGDLRSDRKYFDKYFFLFSPASENDSRTDCYNKFRDACNLKYRNK